MPSKGELKSPNFTSCYVDYLNELLEKNPKVRKIIIWSDGHTHMECDSFHLIIGKALKNTTVNLPSDYIQIIQWPRKNKHGKYRVKYVDFTFLKD